MKMLKKLTAVVMLACMMVVVLSGCAEKATTTGEGDFSKKLELTVWSTQGSDFVAPVTAKENLVENWLIDKTNVRIKNAYGNGGGQWESVLARLIAGDNFPEFHESSLQYI